MLPNSDRRRGPDGLDWPRAATKIKGWYRGETEWFPAPANSPVFRVVPRGICYASTRARTRRCVFPILPQLRSVQACVVCCPLATSGRLCLPPRRNRRQIISPAHAADRSLASLPTPTFLWRPGGALISRHAGARWQNKQREKVVVVERSQHASKSIFLKGNFRAEYGYQ